MLSVGDKLKQLYSMWRALDGDFLLFLYCIMTLYRVNGIGAYTGNYTDLLVHLVGNPC